MLAAVSTSYVVCVGAAFERVERQDRTGVERGIARDVDLRQQIARFELEGQRAVAVGRAADGEIAGHVDRRIVADDAELARAVRSDAHCKSARSPSAR